MVGPGGWTTRINAHNDVEWIPPAHLDTGQARINDYHRIAPSGFSVHPTTKL